jgi:hypothetical protein
MDDSQKAVVTMIIMNNMLASMYIQVRDKSPVRMAFSESEGKHLVEHIKDITKKDIKTFTSRFSKEGYGLGSIFIKFQEISGGDKWEQS